MPIIDKKEVGMEINNFSEKFFQIGQKYSLNKIDKNGDGVISQDEVLSLIEQDEEVSTKLETADISQIEIAQSVNKTDDNITKNTASEALKTSKSKIKTMEEYKEIFQKKFEELYELYDNFDDIYNHIRYNEPEFLDFTGDGRVDKIDQLIMSNLCQDKDITFVNKNNSNYNNKGREYLQMQQKFANNLKTLQNQSVRTSELLYDFTDIDNYIKLGGKAGNLQHQLNITAIVQEDDWETKFDMFYNNKTVKSKIKAVQEYINTNPQNIQYAAISATYNNLKKEDSATNWGE